MMRQFDVLPTFLSKKDVKRLTQVKLLILLLLIVFLILIIDLKNLFVVDL